VSLIPRGWRRHCLEGRQCADIRGSVIRGTGCAAVAELVTDLRLGVILKHHHSRQVLGQRLGQGENIVVSFRLEAAGPTIWQVVSSKDLMTNAVLSVL